MHMYTTSIVAKMHKIQFIRKKENIFACEKDGGISENQQFLTAADEVSLRVSKKKKQVKEKEIKQKKKRVKQRNASQAAVTAHLFFTRGNFNKNFVEKNGGSLI